MPRELIIALPENYTEYDPDEVLKEFTEKFKGQYGVECTSALHYNKTKTILELLIRQAKLPPKPKPGIDMAVFKEMKKLLHQLRKCASEIKQIQDTELPELRAQLAETTGIFKGKERIAIEAKNRDR